MPMNAMDRGFKGQMFNGGVRVPFIAYPTRNYSRGNKSDAMISALDILPTALQVADIQIPDSLQVEGCKTLCHCLKVKTTRSPHAYLWLGRPRH